MLPFTLPITYIHFPPASYKKFKSTRQEKKRQLYTP